MSSRGIRTWLLLHAILDMGLGAGLFLLPDLGLAVTGWTADEVVVRLIGSALFAFGLATALARNAPAEVRRAVLATIVAWNALAILALLIAYRGGDASALLLTPAFLLFGAAFAWYLHKGTGTR